MKINAYSKIAKNDSIELTIQNVSKRVDYEYGYYRQKN